MIYNKIARAIERDKRGVFFVYEKSEIKKTFMWRILCECVRSKVEIVYHVASSGIGSCYFLNGGLQ